MDLNDLKNTVSNLTLYDLKAGFRKAQNAVMNYTEMESKVREATNNEPWGASSTLMQEIANGTFNYQTLNEIMPMIYRRFTEKSAEEWRQIYKALQLLEFLIKHGSERVIDDARGHITLLKMLRQFHFIDQNGKDQGINVRNRAKELAELLSDVERIRSERKKARATKNKYTGVEGGMSFGGGFSGGSSSGRFGGFGNESSGYGGSNADYGGYSGGVYGDGGGFGGQASDFRDTGGRSDRFEEYDEFDEGERPAASSRPKRTTERAGVKKTTGEVAKKKEPEVDLFSFDEPSQSSSAAAPTPSNGSRPAGVAGPSGGGTTNDDDEFDDFQEATPVTQPVAPSGGYAQPLSPPLTSTATSSTQFAAPQPLSAPQKADLSQMVSTSSISPAPSGGVNYSAFASPPAQSQAPKPSGFQSTGPNYFGTVSSQPTAQASGSMSSMSPMAASSGPTTMANMKPVTSPGGKPAAAGGDAFGALWGKASGGIKKTATPTGGASMGQLAKEKSAAGIWGAPASAPSQPAAGRPAPSGGSASDDLLG
ncbi:Epsin-3, clathrin recruitment and traffic between the Golgi and endosome [Purpureocillium takamizusanense]|uniref:Epsin-3, clathrin recruitment and traffic between the Golgi and endosome n=1 Tax=Purpureocillium takamizusanense TaxID=2060973 RepID=A0A9Q8QPC1_9HYPO|nr:Epsin-3, clathrin recruitment and traffic between the Golgi and endosome [Purpureocillium takamizusanense]UNI23325.1 Epsin-3, clathrin recruitment and traffic between the Golgi and endosome [Purpureocillium takamizusanense]